MIDSIPNSNLRRRTFLLAIASSGLLISGLFIFCFVLNFSLRDFIIVEFVPLSADRSVHRSIIDDIPQVHSRFRRRSLTIEESESRIVVGQSSTNGSESEERRRSPKAIIIGVKKGGTRALLEYLRMHPDVRAPGPEVHYFDRHYHLGEDWYRRQMPPTSRGQVGIEKTPSYFVTKEAPSRLKKFDPRIKLIVVLRNPVTRALSDYAQNSAKRPYMANFEEMAFVDTTSSTSNQSRSLANRSMHSSETLDPRISVNTSYGAIRIGIYHRYVRKWLEHFDLERVHFVSGERLITDPAAETNLVERFLGLKSAIDQSNFVYPESNSGVRSRRMIPADDRRADSSSANEEKSRRFPCLAKKGSKLSPHPRCLGKTKGRRHPRVDEKYLKILNDFYRPHNEKLFKMIGRKFDWD